MENNTTWIEEGELAFDFADLKQEAYNALGITKDTDDLTDDAINRILDMRGLRQIVSGSFRFDAESTREDYADAVLAGMRSWNAVPCDDCGEPAINGYDGEDGQQYAYCHKHSPRENGPGSDVEKPDWDLK